MARDVFVDTSGFYALLVKRDQQHQAASRFLRRAAKQKRRFVTTDYVLDETATLLKARGHAHLLPDFFDAVFASNVCAVEWVDPVRFRDTQAFFLKYGDHAWSFTDCLSFIVMRQLRLADALTKDEHFQEAGFTVLLAA